MKSLQFVCEPPALACTRISPQYYWLAKLLIYVIIFFKSFETLIQGFPIETSNQQLIFGFVLVNNTHAY